MVNLFAAVKGQQTQGYVQSRISVPGAQQVAPYSPTEAYRVNSQMRDSDGSDTPDWWGTTVGGAMLAAPVDIIDSVGAIFPGMKRGQINDAVYGAVGLTGFSDWVRENHGAVEIASGIAGALAVGIGAELAAARIISSGWFAATGVGRAAQPLLSMVGRAQQSAAKATQLAAAEGRAFTFLTKENMKFVGLATGQGVLKASVSELAVVGALHKNSAVWSDDMGTNLLFAALGLGLGGTVAGVQARSAAYKWANSVEIRSTVAKAADPGEYQRIMTEAPMSGMTKSTVPKDSTILTAMMLDARQDDVLVTGATQTAQRRAIQTEQAGQAKRVLQKITTAGSPVIDNSAFSIERTSEGLHLEEALGDDPTALFSMANISRVDPEVPVTQQLAARQKSIGRLGKSKKTVDNELANLESTRTPLVMVNKAWMPVRDAEEILGFHPSNVQAKRTAKGLDEYMWESGYSGKRFILRDDGSINAKWDELATQDVLGVAEAMNQAMNKMLAGKKTFQLAKDAHYSQIDMALEYQKRGGEVDFAPSGFVSRDAAELASLKQKAAVLGKTKTFGVKERIKLNLPAQTLVERASDADGVGLRKVVQSAVAPNASVQEIKRLRGEMQRVFDLTQDVRTTDTLSGDLFNFNRSRKNGQWMNPVIGFFDDTAGSKWTKFDLSDMVQEVKIDKINTLTKSPNAPLVNTISTGIVNAPESRLVMDMVGLADGQLSGTDNVVSASAGQFLTQAHRFRNSPALLGAQAIRRVVNRVTELFIDDVFKRLKPVVDQLTSVAGSNSRVLLNQYLSQASGWEIAKTVAQADGTVGFELLISANNARRLGRPVRTGELMVNPRTGKPVVLDSLGDTARKAMEAELKGLLKERNVIRAANGLEPIKFRPFYVPPQSTRGKVVGFTLDSANRVVPGGAIVADSEAAFVKAAEKLESELPPGHRFLRQDEIRRHADIWEQAGMDFIDPTLMAAPGKHVEGGLASSTVNPKAIDEMLMYLKTGYEQITNGTVRTLYEGQLRVSAIRQAAEASTRGRPSGTKSIWEVYTESLMGVPGTKNPTGLSGLTQKMDDWSDKAIATAWPIARVSSAHLRSVANMAGMKRFSSVKSFTDLADELGERTPFKDAIDYADYVHGIKAPWLTKDVGRFVNRIGAGVILRWLEIPHAAMNMAGIITNMPGILAAKNVPTVGRVGGVNVVDTTKVMAKGFSRMFRDAKSNTRDWAMMVRNGDTTQDVAELHMQMSLLKGKSQFAKFMTGDPSSSSAWKKKGVEGVASIIADTSESLSRRWAHFVGLELADYHGITGLEARHNFARQVANDSIANYDPLNRPEIFQSGFGSMYGLFLSYAQNYYQRLFRWMEDAEYKAIGRSLAMQASMFGFMGLPGSRQLATLLGGEEDGEGLVDGIYERFGPAAGSVVAQGGFNQLVTLFGLPPVALHTRGDSNFRHPSLDFATSGTLQLPVGLEVLKDVATGVFEVVGKMVDPSDPMTGRYAAEIIARNMPSRMLKGTLSLMATGGQEADGYGNLMSENKSFAEAAYRFLGLRSGRQQAEIEAYFMNQKALAVDAQKMDGVRTATRALVRSGEFDKLPQVFESYLDAGGKPWNYSSWIQGIIKDASETRGSNQLQRALRSPGQQALARRIEMFTGGQ